MANKKKESSIERLGRFIQESEYADMLFNSMVGCAHSDVVHVDVEFLAPNGKENFIKDLKMARDEICEWFQFDRENLYMMLYALERIKRKFRIDFD
jgi:hypothetical protein